MRDGAEHMKGVWKCEGCEGRMEMATKVKMAAT